GASLHATGVLMDGNATVGVLAFSPETRITLEGCNIRDTRPRPGGNFGRGLEADDGASLHATGVLISHSGELGAMFIGAAPATLTDVIVDTVAPGRRGFGVGLYVLNTEVRGTRTAFQHVAGAGVAALPDPAMPGSVPPHVRLDDVFV